MNDQINKKISDALGIDPIPSKKAAVVTTTVEEEQTPPAEVAVPEEEAQTDLLSPQQIAEVRSVAAMTVIQEKSIEDHIVDEDFDEARDNLKKIISTTGEVIDNLQLLALESESARHYEVLAALLKNAADANDKLLDLSKKKKDIKRLKDSGRSEPDQPIQGQSINIDKAVFVGTTDELAKMSKNSNIPNA